MDFGSKHRKRRWYTTAVGGLAGVTGLAALTLVANSSNVPGLGGLGGPRSALGQQFETGGGDANGKDGSDHKVIKVDCDPDELIAAVQRATSDGGATLELAKKCTYTLTAYEYGNGLPVIKAPVKIHGNGSTITRAANAADFRFFEVEAGGHLTLRHVTLKNGRSYDDGGAVLVDEGGKATVEDSTFVFNRAEGLGGAIANYGITKISGGEGKDKADEKDKKKAPKDSKSDDEWWSEDRYSNDKDGVGNSHSLLSRNFAEDDGGALYNDGAMAVEHTRVAYNTTQDDGGGLATDSTAVVKNSAFDHNHAGDDGGAFYVTNGGLLKVKDTYVTDNTANGEGGALRVNDDETAYVWGSKLNRNLSDDDGGGASNAGTLAVEDSELNLNETVFGMGGGLRNDGGTATLHRSEVNQNRAFDDNNGEGGGIDNGGGSELRLTESEVKENYAYNPAGGVDNNGDAEVDDETTIIKNVPTNCQNVPNCFG
jgi:hypothetical protein